MTDPRFAYPIVLNLAGRRALVVGGGRVALRKAQTLADAGARVRVVSPRFLAVFRKDKRLECVAEAYGARHMAGAILVVAATDDETANARVADDARARGALVNVVDRPALCDFIVPAVLARGDLVIAVATGGAAPSLARRLRERLEKNFIGPEYAAYLKVMREVRARVQKCGLPEKVRRRIFERLSEDDILAAARRGMKTLRRAVAKILDAAMKKRSPRRKRRAH